MRGRGREKEREGGRSIEHSHYLFSIVTRGATSQATNSPLQLYRHPTALSLANTFVPSSIPSSSFSSSFALAAICERKKYKNLITFIFRQLLFLATDLSDLFQV